MITIRFSSREVKFLPSLARELGQVCEWNLTNIGLHRLADRAISKAKKLNVVMPVNASNFCYVSYRPVTVCVKDVSRLKEYAQQNHIFFIPTVSKAWPNASVLESGGSTRLSLIKRSPHVRMSSIDPMVLISRRAETVYYYSEKSPVIKFGNLIIYLTTKK